MKSTPCHTEKQVTPRLPARSGGMPGSRHEPKPGCGLPLGAEPSPGLRRRDHKPRSISSVWTSEGRHLLCCSQCDEFTGKLRVGRVVDRPFVYSSSLARRPDTGAQKAGHGTSPL